MSITIDMLNQNPTLAGLPDEQKTAIAEMSRNDENTVIGTRIGELHGRYDADIFGVTGIAKKDGEKSYDYAKRVLTDYKAKADSARTLKADLDAARAKAQELQTRIEKGEGNEALSRQLEDARNRVSQLQAQLQSKETEFTSARQSYEKSLRDVHVDYAFQAATSGLTFRDGITDTVKRVLLDAAKAEVLAKGTPDFIDDGKGGKTLVFRGQDGNILNNPANNLNPYTLKELIMGTSLKDAIAEGRRQTGGGTGGRGSTGGSGGTGGTFDTSGARTQVEADRMISEYLLSMGLTRDSKEFSEQLYKIRSENEVSKLPIR